jgi:imidazolonepropionase-like amidohydrolase
MRRFSLSRALALTALALPCLAADIAVKGRVIRTVSSGDIADGVIIVKDGKIAAIGPSSSVVIPEGMRVLEAAVVTPGLVDAHSVVGLAGYLNQPHDQDQLDGSAPIQPELRAIDSYDARERLIEWARGFGVTTLHTGHGPGALISGQTMIAKTRGATVDEAVIRPLAMMAATLGESAVESEEKKTPGTRSKLVAALRAELMKAQDHARKVAHAKPEEPVARDLRLEALLAVLRREVPLMITAQRHQDIASALRVANEFDLRLVLDGAAESYLLIDEIKAAGVPVLVHPTMARFAGEMENASMDTAGMLRRAGIPVALQTGYESYVPKTRVLLWEAAQAASRGMGADAALAAITLDAARILGVADRVGSLEVGKDGDLALYDGDPFEWTTHCIATIIDGVPESVGPR